MADPTPQSTAPAVRAVVFRVPLSALVGVAFLVMCESVVAFAVSWGWLLFLVPVGLVVWLLRTRTTVDAERVVARRVFRRDVLPWSTIASLRVADKSWVRAVRVEGGEVALPAVHARHLPVISIVSGGRVPDPTEPPAQ
jgi:hypothetical protein